MSKEKWETINQDESHSVERLKIEGGWIYHLFIKNTDYAQTFFVPEPDRCEFHREHVVKVCASCLREEANK